MRDITQPKPESLEVARRRWKRWAIGSSIATAFWIALIVFSVLGFGIPLGILGSSFLALSSALTAGWSLQQLKLLERQGGQQGTELLSGGEGIKTTGQRRS